MEVRIDKLIRKYGDRGTPATLAAVENRKDLAKELSAAAHLIHGSSDGRFQIPWWPGELTKQEVAGIGFGLTDVNEMMSLYNPAELQHGYNKIAGEEIVFIPNPEPG